jgi:hypothetical protein
MRLYLDDDSASGVLVKLLIAAGHDVLTPQSAGIRGQDDSVHFTLAVRQDRTLLSRNHDDFANLHELVMETGGTHPGILIVRFENNRRRDMTDQGIVRALDNLLAANVMMENQFFILNQWR